MNSLLTKSQPLVSRTVLREPQAPTACTTSRRLLTMGESRRRILYVDDDALLRELGEQVLIRQGYDVDTVEDGAEAWNALHDHDYQLLITDNQMPGLTGLELIRKVRQEHMSLPVILVSAALGTVSAGELAQLETEATLAKPFTAEELISAIREAMRPTDSKRTFAGDRLPACARFQFGHKPRRNWGINE